MDTDKLARTIADALKTSLHESRKSSSPTHREKRLETADFSLGCRRDFLRFVLDVPVGVSARHIHLSRQHVEILFGSGYQLTKKQELMGGQFAAYETVTIVGPKLSAIENVRVLGPEREFSQVEISATDGVKLGVKAPLRESGDLRGSAPISVVGPKGTVFLSEGCIIAARHIHMSPADAKKFGVKDGDMVSAEVKNQRGVILKNIKIRVDESFTTQMHLDTDEANACFVKTGDRVKILRTG